MTREEAESNFDRNWEEMLELQKGKTDWAREEMRASVKGVYASELRDACISLEAQLKAKESDLERQDMIIKCLNIDLGNKELIEARKFISTLDYIGSNSK